MPDHPPRDPTAPELAELLQQVLAPEPPDAASAERIKRLWLRRIAHTATDQHLTIRADDGAWRALGDGLSLKLLHRDGELMSYLVRMAPGSALPAHHHPVDEECVVLEGELQVGQLRIGAGGFHLGRRGLPHAPIRSDGGALIYLRGAVPAAALLI